MAAYSNRPNGEPAQAKRRVRIATACLALLASLAITAMVEYTMGQVPPNPVGEDRATIHGHKQVVTAVAFSANGKLMATAAGNQGNVGEVKIWNVTSHEEQGSVPGLPVPALALAFAPDSKTVAVACADGTLRLLNLENLQFGSILKGHVGRVFAVAFTRDSKTLASAGEDKTVRFWDAVEGKERRILKG